MTSVGPEETFLVVASTDLERANIMMTRINEQLGKVPDLNGNGELQVSASAVALRDGTGSPLEQQVQEVAREISEMVGIMLGENLGRLDKERTTTLENSA